MSTKPDDVNDAAQAAKAKQSKKTVEAEKKAADIKEAIEYLRGTEMSFDAVIVLADSLKKRDEFGYAWRILAKARKKDGVRADAKTYLKIVQKSALNTYKDVNLPLEKRLDDALKILVEEANLAETKNQETLGLAGAIYKRKWEADNQRQHLERSLFYYERGYQQGPLTDQGYTAINAAYISYLLGYLEAELNPAGAESHRAKAREICEKIIADVPRLTEPPLGEIEDNKYLKTAWFFYSTVGEAYFGLGRYEEALDWLVTRPEAAGAGPPEWEFETTARQLAGLARIRAAAAVSNAGFENDPAWQAFEEFLSRSKWGGPGGVSSEAVRHGFDGKVGLALSGGGFRASLFHIGVLARLAELDVLRRVEVMSCVSGGSIVGAHYYLEVRDLLRKKRDEEITPKDYMEIVERIEKRFVAGVQRNLRMRVAASLSANLKMILKPGYSRTLRLGELYEEELYSLVDDRADGDKKKERYLHELTIVPRLGDAELWEGFKPKLHNWRRRSKAPIMILNAATLNTGHNWQFTATYMGESPAAIHSEIDSVYRLRRKSYTDEPHSPDKPQLIRLGHAVAASSCVPVLFEPIVLTDTYERQSADGKEKVSVRLVDGGVCDNQGVASLLEQDCNILLVSDGSGQIEASDSPGTAAIPVAMRSNGVLQARIRGTQYRELDARERSSLLRGLMFVHLKKDLDNNPVDWEGCPAHQKIAPADGTEDVTSYGIPKDIQKRLAQIRTDLDTFCDLESLALMTSGYLMTKSEYKNCFGKLPEQPGAGRWNFLGIEVVMKNSDNKYGDEKKYLERVLDAGSGLAFKVWKLSPGLKTLSRIVTWLAVLLSLGGLALAVWTFSGWRGVNVVAPGTLKWVGGALTFGLIAVALVALILAALVVHVFGRVAGVTRWSDTLARKVVGVLLLVFGYPAAKIHLWLFDESYRKCGSLDRVAKPKPAVGGPTTEAHAGD